MPELLYFLVSVLSFPGDSVVLVSVDWRAVCACHIEIGYFCFSMMSYLSSLYLQNSSFLDKNILFVLNEKGRNWMGEPSIMVLGVLLSCASRINFEVQILTKR